MTLLAVAALSARVLAEAARAEGFEVVALDVFGDADTRHASSQWLPIGAPGGLQIDAERLLAGLAVVAQRDDAAGWIAGSGFEAWPQLLERGAALLPLIGTDADAVRRVREPRHFFAHLASEGIAHPPVRMSPPADPCGWLVKDAQGFGGWHIRRATPATEAVPGRHYFQRETPGTPMSATFVANGADATVLGFNQLIVRPFGARPFVYCGAIGPLPLRAAVAARVTAAVRGLAAAFELRGLGSLDFMLDGDAFAVLEVNPRPPASMALYPAQGVVGAHLRACLDRELPPPVHPGAGALLHGTEIVYARHPLWADAAAVRQLAARAGCHDRPAAAARFDAGDPVCSVGATGANAAQVLRRLARARDAIHQSLETLP